MLRSQCGDHVAFDESGFLARPADAPEPAESAGSLLER